MKLKQWNTWCTISIHIMMHYIKMLALPHQSNITERQMLLTYSSEQLLQAVSNGPDYVHTTSTTHPIFVVWTRWTSLWKAYYQFGGAYKILPCGMLKSPGAECPFCNIIQTSVTSKIWLHSSGLVNALSLLFRITSSTRTVSRIKTMCWSVYLT